MKIIGTNNRKTNRIVNYIVKRRGDCEQLLKHDCGSWYGKQLFCNLLFASYGVIGYSILYNNINIDVDNELNYIRIY